MGLEHKERLLRKVKLNNDGGATVLWQDVWWNPETQAYVKDDDERTRDGRVHEDLKNAMAKLTEHLVLACEMVPDVKGNYGFDGSLKGLEKFSISSVTLSGGEHKEDEDRSPVAAHLFGNKRLKTGHVVNFGSYGIKMGAPQEKYKFVAELESHIAAVEAEAWQYLDGKVAPPAQTSLDLTDREPIEGSENFGGEGATEGDGDGAANNPTAKTKMKALQAGHDGESTD